jgi:hypothetical protein
MIKKFFKLGCLFFIVIAILQVILVVVYGDEQKNEGDSTAVIEQKQSVNTQTDSADKIKPKSQSSITDYELLPITRVGLDYQNRATQKLVLKSNSEDEASIKNLVKDIWTKRGKSFNEYTIFVYEPNMDTSDSAAYLAEFGKNGLKEFLNLKY